jgi:hypothetical protein
VCQTTIPISLTVSHNHHERITFLILDSSVHSVVLAFPWIQLHNPRISWMEVVGLVTGVSGEVFLCLFLYLCHLRGTFGPFQRLVPRA